MPIYIRHYFNRLLILNSVVWEKNSCHDHELIAPYFLKFIFWFLIIRRLFRGPAHICDVRALINEDKNDKIEK